MANAFNLTAQLNLRGPTNIKPIIKGIKSQLGNINANVNLVVAKNSSAQVAKLDASLRKLNTTLNTTATASKNAAQSIRDLGAAIGSINAGNVSTSINAAAQASAKLKQEQKDVAKSLQGSRTEMEEFGKQAGLAIRRFAAFSAVTAVVYKLNNAITNGVGAFIDFQKEFIRLQQVTGESAQNLSSLRNTITQLSTGLGVASQDLTTVSVTLAQAGLNARETEQALKALAQSALAPSFDNLNNTVEGSIALMRQFGISSNELGSALGSINAVAASFAVEAGDIIKAISRTGGVFANASKGVSEGTDALNEFIAVFTSVRSTTRESAETIATGLRTIFTRIQRGSTIDALKEFGVTLTDLEGKFVGPYKAIQLLSEGLGRLDPRDIRFSQIVEELGGFRQIGKVIPLIQQFTVAQRALGVAQAGTGSLAEDAAIAQLSLANQISKVREEFLSLFREIGSSDSFQIIAKGALSVTSAIISVTDSIKGVLPVLAILAASKGLSALTQFGAGFIGGIQRGGGARGFGQRLSGAPSGFARGGLVPGAGNGDTVPAMLTPGEFVIRKKAVQAIGVNNLAKANKYARGGLVNLKKLSPGMAGSTNIPSAIDRYDELQDEDTVSNTIIRKSVTKADIEKQFGSSEKFKSGIESTRKKEYESYYRPVGEGFAFEDVIFQNPSKFGLSGRYIKAPTSNYPVDLVPLANAAPVEIKYKNEAEPDPFILNKHFRYLLEKKLWKSKGFTPKIDPDIPLGNIRVIELADGVKDELYYPQGVSDKTKSKRENRLAKRQQKITEAGFNLGDRVQKLADGAFVKQGEQSGGVGIFDSDMIGAGSKQILNALLSSGKPYEVINGPAGSGKTTFATSRFGKNFVTSPQDFDRYSKFVVLSGAGATKSGDLSPAAIQLMSGATKTTVLAPPADRLMKQRQSRLEAAQSGALPDKRSTKQLEGTLKAPTGIDRALFKRFKSVDILEKYASGGIIQDIASNAQLQIGAAVLENFNTSSSPLNIKEADIKQALQRRAGFDPKKEKINKQSISLSNIKSIGGIKQGLSKETSESFRSAIDQGLVEAVNYAGGRLSQDLGIGFTAVDEGSKTSFLNGINDASVGNLYEDVLTGIANQYTNRVSGQNFDFPSGLGPNLKDNYPGLPEKWVDAKASAKQAQFTGDGSLKAKTLNQIADEINKNKQQYIQPISEGSEQAQMAVAKSMDPKKTYLLSELRQFGIENTQQAKEKGLVSPFRGKWQLAQEKNLGGLIQKFAVGGSAEDTVPALLTPGEFVINKKAANRIGSAKLHQMNKADKIRGYNKGGFVGFADGGGVPLRPDKISASTVAIPDSVKDSLSQLVDVLRSVGIESANASKIIDNQGRVSYKAALEASKADLERLKIAGASASDIAAAEKFLLDIRNQAAKEIKTRRNLEKTFKTGGAESAAQQADISLKAEELAQQKIQNVTRARKANNEEVTAEDISKARDSAFLAATRQVTGISAADLKKTGLTGSDIQAYIAGTQLDPKEAKKFNDQWLKSRTAILGGSRKAEQQAKQELKAREKITRQIQRARGLPTGGGFFGRGKEFLGNLTKGQAGLGASIALPLLTNALVGGEATSSSGAATQAFAQGATGAVSGGLALASIGGPIGIAAGLVSAGAGLVKAFADAKNAATEFARQASRTRIERSGEQLSKVFDKLAKDAENVDLLRAARTEIATITSESQSLMRSNTNDITYGLVNAIEMIPGLVDSGNSFQRGEILQNQGVLPYIESLFSGDDRERLFSKEQPRLDQENAKIFQQANAQTQQYIQSLINSGKTATDLLNDPAFLNIAQNLALADANVQRAVRELGGVDSAAGRQYLQEVTRERAVEQINISVKTKQLDELNRIAGELSISFSRLFDTMNQQINAASYRLAEFNKNLSASVDSLSGRPSIGTDTSFEAINILQNPLAYSDAEFRGASDRGASFFGGDAELVSGLVQIGPNIEDKLLGVINNVLATSGDNPEKASREINKAIADQLKNLNLPPEIRNKLAREISVAVGDIAKETDKGSISLQDLTEKISGLNNVIQSSQKAREGVINALTYWQNSLNSYSAAINQMVEIQLEAANRIRRANQIVFDSQVSLANALGQDVSLRFVEREQERETRSRTGGPTDPADIAIQLRALEDRRADQQAALSAVQSDVAAPGASANIVRMTQELSQTNYAIAETRAALENLANNSDLASAALNKIQKAQQDQAGKVSFIEKLVTSTPEQLQNLNNSFADLQRYISGQAISIQQSTAAQKAYRKALRSGATRRDAQKEAQRAFADQRGNALSLLKEIGPFLGDSQQANNLRADALETMLRESGVGVNVMMRQVLDAMKNPELDPATAAAIETYKEATRIQSEANLELARLNNDLSGQIAKDTASAIKEALETATVKFDQSQIDAMLDGMRNLGRDGDRQGLAAGGIVYASVGGQMFTPKGTDTVPAMLTPGEFVVNRAATQKNLPILKAINNGYAKGGSVRYYNDGGFVAGKIGVGPDELFKDWQYDSKEKYTQKEIATLSFNGEKALQVQKGGFGIGWAIKKSSATLADNKFDIGVAGINEALSNSDKTLEKTELGIANLDPVLTNKAANVALNFKDYALSSSRIDAQSATADIGGKSTIDLEYPSNIIENPPKEMDKAAVDAKILQYKDVLKAMGNIVDGTDAYIYEQDGGISVNIVKDLGKLAQRIRKPKIEAEYKPGFVTDEASILFTDLSQQVGGNIGFGFLDSAAFSNNLTNSLLTWTQPDGSGTSSLEGLKRTGGINQVGVGAVTLDKIGASRAGVTIKDFQKQRNIIYQALRELEDQDKPLGLSKESRRRKSVIDKLSKVHKSTSPYIAETFQPSDGLDFSLIGGEKEPTRVYGGTVGDFENAFGPNIDNAIARGEIEEKNIYGGRLPRNLLEISKAEVGGYSDAKSFAWTQGVKSSLLDAEFDKKRAEEEAKQKAITVKALTKDGSFKLPVIVHGDNKQLDIPYKLHYGEWDGKLFDENTNKYSDQLLSQIWGSKAYIIGTAQGTNVDAAFDPYAGYDTGSTDIVTGLKNNAYNSDVIVKPDYIKKQFEQAAVKDYIGKVLEQGKTDIPEKNAAEALMESVLKGFNNGGDINFFRKTNNVLSDYRAPKNIPINSNKFNFRDYLSAVVGNLLTKQKDALAQADGEVANIDEFTDRYSRDLSLLIPAFETLGKTAFSLFGPGAPYNYGAPFGVNVGNVQNLTAQNIRDLSGILAKQLDQYYKNIGKYVAEGYFNNRNAYDFANNAEIFSYGAQQVFAGLASGNTNKIARYLKPADLTAPNFNWQNLQPQALTLFRAIGGQTKAAGFFSEQLSEDDKLDLEGIIGDGDVIREVGAKGKITKKTPNLTKIGDVVKLAFNPYNRFDEITDRKILINTLKDRISVATGPNGRPLYSRQMMNNVLDSMEALKIWFGGEPGANAGAANPPRGFDDEGIYQQQASANAAAGPQNAPGSGGGLIPGIVAAGAFLPGLPGMVAAGAGVALGLGAPVLRVGAWKGIDYLYDTDPPEPDHLTRYNELQNSFDQNIYDRAKKGLEELGGLFDVGSLPALDHYKTQYRKTGGMIYASQGQLVNFEPKGTDTVPAMLTPGEFVINREATRKNLPLLKAINSGGESYSSGGMMYAAGGTDEPVAPRRPFDPGYQPQPQKPVKSNRKARIQQFNKLDKNGDGILTSDEFSFIDRAWDTNFDSKITLDEYLGWFETASPSDLRSFRMDRSRIADKNRVSSIEENQRQIRDDNRANYEARRAFQRARSNALREGMNVYEANAAGQQAYADSMNNYNAAQTQKREDIKGGSTDYVFYRNLADRDAAIDRTARLKAERAAREAGQQAYDQAKADGRSEDEAWKAYQSSFDDANKPDDYRDAAAKRLKERENRKAKLDQMTPIQRSNFLRKEREQNRAKKAAEAAEKKAEERRVADEKIKQAVEARRRKEEAREQKDKELGLEETLERLYTNESDRDIYRSSIRKKLEQGAEQGQSANDVYKDIRKKEKLGAIRSRYTYHTTGADGTLEVRLGKPVKVDAEKGVITYQQIDPVTGELTDNYTYEPVNTIRENDPKAYKRAYDTWLSQEGKAYDERKNRKPTADTVFDYSGKVEDYQPRTWVDKDGQQFTGTVTEVGSQGATVTLADGTTRVIPRNELTQDDAKYVDSVRRYQTDIRVREKDRQDETKRAQATAQADAFMQRGVLAKPDLGSAAETKLQEAQDLKDSINKAAQDRAAIDRTAPKPGIKRTSESTGGNEQTLTFDSTPTTPQRDAAKIETNNRIASNAKAVAMQNALNSMLPSITSGAPELRPGTIGGGIPIEEAGKQIEFNPDDPIPFSQTLDEQGNPISITWRELSNARIRSDLEKRLDKNGRTTLERFGKFYEELKNVPVAGQTVKAGEGVTNVLAGLFKLPLAITGGAVGEAGAQAYQEYVAKTLEDAYKDGVVSQKDLEQKLLNDPVYQFFNGMSKTGFREVQRSGSQVLMGGTQVGEALIDDTTQNIEAFLKNRNIDANIKTKMYTTGLPQEVRDYHNRKTEEKYDEAAELGITTPIMIADIASEIGPDAFFGPAVVKGIFSSSKTVARTTGKTLGSAARATKDLAVNTGTKGAGIVDNIITSMKKGPAKTKFEKSIGTLRKRAVDSGIKPDRADKLINELIETNYDRAIVQGVTGDLSDADALALAVERRQRLVARGLYDDATAAKLTGTEGIKVQNFQDMDPKAVERYFEQQVKNISNNPEELAKFRQKIDARRPDDTFGLDVNRINTRLRNSTTATTVQTPATQTGPTIRAQVPGMDGPGTSSFDAGFNTSVNNSLFPSLNQPTVARGVPGRQAGPQGFGQRRGRGPIKRNPRNQAEIDANLKNLQRQATLDASQTPTTDIGLPTEVSPGVFQVEGSQFGNTITTTLSDGSSATLVNAPLPDLPANAKGRFGSPNPEYSGATRQSRVAPSESEVKASLTSDMQESLDSTVEADRLRFQNFTGPESGNRALRAALERETVEASLVQASTTRQPQAAAAANQAATPQPQAAAATPQSQAVANKAATKQPAVSSGSGSERKLAAGENGDAIAAEIENIRNPQASDLNPQIATNRPPADNAPFAPNVPKPSFGPPAGTEAYYDDILNNQGTFALIKELLSEQFPTFRRGYSGLRGQLSDLTVSSREALDNLKSRFNSSSPAAAKAKKAATPQPQAATPQPQPAAAANQVATRQPQVGSQPQASSQLPASSANQTVGNSVANPPGAAPNGTTWKRIAGRWVLIGAGTVGAVLGAEYLEDASKPDTKPMPLPPPPQPGQPLPPDIPLLQDEDGNPMPGTNASLRRKRKNPIVYASNGALIAAQSRGTDTVPAMLTPGEFVINRMATQQNRPLLESINSGQFNSGGLVKYLARGGYVSPQRLQDGGQAQQVVQQTQSVTSGVNNVSMERPGWVDEVINAFNGVGPAIMEASSNIGLSAERLANSVPSSVDINQNVNVQGSVGLDSQTLGRAVAMGSQQAGGYTDQKFNNMAAKLQNDTDGGVSFTA